MRKVEKVRIKAHDKEVSFYTCDTCNNRIADTSWGALKKCAICDDYVCKDCAIATDFTYLIPGHFGGDYPYYFCPRCWKLGEKMRTQIMLIRDIEDQLIIDWRRKGKEAKNKDK